MKILVMKFGGTSVADPARINKVAEIVLSAQAQGFRPVVVVSAMGDTTFFSGSSARMSLATGRESCKNQLIPLPEVGTIDNTNSSGTIYGAIQS